MYMHNNNEMKMEARNLKEIRDRHMESLEAGNERGE